jgi:hypothetical protein
MVNGNTSTDHVLGGQLVGGWSTMLNYNLTNTSLELFEWCCLKPLGDRSEY